MRFDELIIVAVIAVVVLGPQRLPEYAAKLARLIKQLRVMAEGAKGQLKEQLGPEYRGRRLAAVRPPAATTPAGSSGRR